MNNFSCKSCKTVISQVISIKEECPLCTSKEIEYVRDVNAFQYLLAQANE